MSQWFVPPKLGSTHGFHGGLYGVIENDNKN